MSKIRNVAWAVGRIASRGAGQNRTVNATFQAAKAASKTFLGIGHLLWLQITGVCFIFFGIGFVARIPRSYQAFLQHKEPVFNLAVLVAVALAFFWFGLTAFARARRRQQELRRR